MARIVHVIPQSGAGGGARAMLSLVDVLPDHSHRIIGLKPGAAGESVVSGRSVPLVEAPGPAELRSELEAADIVHVHFWNSPEMFEFLRGPWPPARLVVWFFMRGDAAPQVVVPELVGFADLCVPSSAYTAALPVFDGVPHPLIETIPDPARLVPLASVPHDGFAVGYIGTVDPVKMHPRFTAMSAAVQVPDATFVVCGIGGAFADIAREAEALGARDRFDLRGYTPDPAPVFAALDVFGYPLAPDNYAATDLVLAEAMAAGVPPVVLDSGTSAATVRDGVTGIVAPDEAAYVAAIERLAGDPALRAKLASGAREEARTRWAPGRFADTWTATYDRILATPKRERHWPGPVPSSGAECFMASLGATAESFRSSFSARGPETAADDLVAASSPTVAKSDGGVLDYRRRYPGDAHLALWAGLVLESNGSRVLAAGELARARRLGIDAARTDARIAAISEQLSVA